MLSESWEGRRLEFCENVVKLLLFIGFRLLVGFGLGGTDAARIGLIEFVVRVLWVNLVSISKLFELWVDAVVRVFLVFAIEYPNLCFVIILTFMTYYTGFTGCF